MMTVFVTLVLRGKCRRTPIIGCTQAELPEDDKQLAASEAVVVPIGSRHPDTTANVVPDESLIKLNARTFEEGVRRCVLAALARIVNAEAAASGAPMALEITPLDRYALVVNDAAVNHKVGDVKDG
jgi:metal-dependent amidase/aminoacylase/carboxypeptidase family protein